MSDLEIRPRRSGKNTANENLRNAGYTSNDLYSQIRGAWEVHATTKMGMSAGRALSDFDHFIEGLMAQSRPTDARGRTDAGPSEAQVYDAETAFWAFKERTGVFRGAMRAALRAASEAGGA